MEKRRLRKEIEHLLGEYIGVRLRENRFDPKGKKDSTLLDDLAHYDLAINVALLWLNKAEEKEFTDNEIRVSSSRECKHPNRMEREAMVLSSFAGILMNTLPVDELISLYKYKPSTTRSGQHAKSLIVHPFTLSCHPFAMLTAIKAVEHARKHSMKLNSWKSAKNKCESTADNTAAQAAAPPTNAEECTLEDYHYELP
ncbi:uncharacterized protein C2orf80-like isoform X2 [Acipenser ruthenus]|uniref:uncharacterized protein C2orf80-like isoform X2 n=1 Tax=Acipenser ruthenus TaxID=7906 RepID=UPI0027427907|nr:uncharacterized protein C2orf80-like isoform X2 [Acipenser ruthenus]